MNEVLHRLTELLPPPSHPVFHTGDWSVIEQKLGVLLPDDYKEMVITYGAGSIEPAQMWFINPFYRMPDTHALSASLQQSKISGVTIPFDAFSATIGTGLLPWGATDGGDVFAWNVAGGDASKWHTAFLYDDFRECHVLGPISSTQIIYDILTGVSSLFAIGALDRQNYIVPQRFTSLTLPNQREMKRIEQVTDRACYIIENTISICVPTDWIVYSVHRDSREYVDVMPYFIAESPPQSLLNSTHAIVRLHKSTKSSLLSADMACDDLSDQMNNEWSEFLTGNQDALNAWASEAGVDPATVSELPESHGRRRWVLLGGGEISGQPDPIPWMAYSVYEGKCVISYFWHSIAAWRMDCHLDRVDIQNDRHVFDAIAQSVSFHSINENS